MRQHRAVPAFWRNCPPHTAFPSFCFHETHVPVLQETAVFFGTSLGTSVQLFLPELVNHPSPPTGAPSVLVSMSLFLLFGQLSIQLVCSLPGVSTVASSSFSSSSPFSFSFCPFLPAIPPFLFCTSAGLLMRESRCPLVWGRWSFVALRQN